MTERERLEGLAERDVHVFRSPAEITDGYAFGFEDGQTKLARSLLAEETEDAEDAARCSCGNDRGPVIDGKCLYCRSQERPGEVEDLTCPHCQSAMLPCPAPEGAELTIAICENPLCPGLEPSTTEAHTPTEDVGQGPEGEREKLKGLAMRLKSLNEFFVGRGEIDSDHMGEIMKSYNEIADAIALLAQRQEQGERTLYVNRCGTCGAYEGTVDPNEQCTEDGPHHFGIYERIHPGAKGGR